MKFLLFSPLTRNILLINLITLIIPVLGFLYLVDYRQELIRAETDNLSQESIIFASALAEGAVSALPDDSIFLDLPKALHIVRRLSLVSEKRAILFLQDGTLLADSQYLHNPITQQPMPDESPFYEGIRRAVHQFIDQVEGNFFFPRFVSPQQMHLHVFPNNFSALKGKTESKIWSGERDHLIISVATPVQPMHQILGSLVLVQNTDRPTKTIHQLRENILISFFIAIIFTITMSIILAHQIAKPLSQLAQAARQFGGKEFYLRNLKIPLLKSETDEIGILSRAMREMTENLQQRIMAIENFSADVAHEIRNPISGISSALESYSIIKCEKKRQELMEMAQSELVHIDLIINDILEASRLDSELMSENPALMNVTDWLTNFIQKTFSADDSFLLDISIEKTPLWIAVKPSRLEQVMMNLINNARDFNPPHMPIHIGLRKDNLHHKACFIIADSGVGIPPKMLSKIFERFYSDRPNHEGGVYHTGLGLSIVQQIVEGYKGTIKASNKTIPKTGAIMTMTFPLYEDQQDLPQNSDENNQP